MSQHTPSQLVSKKEAALLLGISLSTFDRARGRLGLRPAPSARIKPIQFRLEDLLPHIVALPGVTEFNAAANGRGVRINVLPKANITAMRLRPLVTAKALMTEIKGRKTRKAKR